jgi:zinc transporter 6
MMPGLTKMLLPRVNPFALIGFASAVALVIAQLLIEARYVCLPLFYVESLFQVDVKLYSAIMYTNVMSYNCRKFYAADTLAAVSIAIMICGTMFPMSIYSGKILLQVGSSCFVFVCYKLKSSCSK